MLLSEVDVKEGQVVKKGNNGMSKLTYQGLSITIENDEGSLRRWKNNEGESGKTTMFYKYGFLEGTWSEADGEGIDCFVGKNPYSSNVYIIKLGIDDFEDKVMLGFSSMEEARDAFLAHYSTQEALGNITEVPMYLFRDMIKI